MTEKTMSDTEREAIIADYQAGEPMVRMPLAAVMEQISDKSAAKAVKAYAIENKATIENLIQTHELKCPTALAFTAFQNKLKGAIIGAYIIGGLSGSGITAMLFKLFT
jgi:hypothetical protein